MTCPRCEQAAAYHGDRDRGVLTPLGPVAFARAYYYCRRCGQGLCPFDAAAGLTDRGLAPALERLAALAGAVGDSFERAADLLREMAGVRLSESTVERATEDAGARVAEQLGRGDAFGPAAAWEWGRDARGRAVAYVSIDATGTRQQGPGGRAAEGRMAYVAAIYDPPPAEWLRPAGPAPPVRARYVSGLYPLAEMGPLLRRQAAQVGMEQAEVWVALTDGGSGLEAEVWVALTDDGPVTRACRRQMSGYDGLGDGGGGVRAGRSPRRFVGGVTRPVLTDQAGGMSSPAAAGTSGARGCCRALGHAHGAGIRPHLGGWAAKETGSISRIVYEAPFATREPGVCYTRSRRLLHENPVPTGASLCP